MKFIKSGWEIGKLLINFIVYMELLVMIRLLINFNFSISSYLLKYLKDDLLEFLGIIIVFG